MMPDEQRLLSAHEAGLSARCAATSGAAARSIYAGKTR